MRKDRKNEVRPNSEVLLPTAFLHADISYKKPIRAQSGKIPNRVLRPQANRHKKEMGGWKMKRETQ
jgi:hypothetical protein